MILFLNPLGDHTSQDNLTESKYIKLLTDELLELNKNLLLAPDSIIGLIDKIYIIVDEDAHFQYLNKNINLPTRYKTRGLPMGFAVSKKLIFGEYLI